MASKVEVEKDGESAEVEPLALSATSTRICAKGSCARRSAGWLGYR